MPDSISSNNASCSRRDFIKVAAGLSVLAATSGVPKVFAQGSDLIRIGLIGCGGRGVYDTLNCFSAASGLELTAVGDVFSDKVESALAQLREKAGDKVKVSKDAVFVGFDAYEKVLASDVDLVILTAPPHFRPEHLRAAVEAGKHVFMEKPVAVDPLGVRSVIESSEIADGKKLKLAVGTQARQMAHRIELMKRIHDGEIGEIIAGECFRLGDGMMDWGVKERQPEWSDMEWQLRRWLFYTWLSGDFITEMHVHELDIVNWAMDANPVKCVATGGRQARTDEIYGDAYDHFSALYEYPGGARITYMGLQINGTTTKTHERFMGTKGTAYTDWAGSRIEGARAWESKPDEEDPVIVQHAKHIRAIREDERLNEARRIAENSLTCIMGRMSAYTGRELKWDWAMKASKLDLSPPSYKMGDLPEPQVAIPGETQLV